MTRHPEGAELQWKLLTKKRASSTQGHIEETRRYLRDFAASLTTTSTAMELYETMLSLHPGRVNPGSLWAAAKASKLSFSLERNK